LFLAPMLAWGVLSAVLLGWAGDPELENVLTGSENNF